MAFYYISNHRLVELDIEIYKGMMVDRATGLRAFRPIDFASLPASEAEKLSNIIEKAKAARAREVELAQSRNGELSGADIDVQHRVISDYKKKFFDLRAEITEAINAFNNHPVLKDHFLTYDPWIMPIEKLLDRNAIYDRGQIISFCNKPRLFVENYDLNFLLDLARIFIPPLIEDPHVIKFYTTLAIHYYCEGDLDSFRALLSSPLRATLTKTELARPLFFKIIADAIKGTKTEWLQLLVDNFSNAEKRQISASVDHLHPNLLIRCALEHNHTLTLALLDTEENYPRGFSSVATFMQKPVEIRLPDYTALHKTISTVPEHFAKHGKVKLDYNNYRASRHQPDPEYAAHPQFNNQVLADIQRTFGFICATEDINDPVAPFNAFPLLFDAAENALKYVRKNLWRHNNLTPFYRTTSLEIPAANRTNWSPKKWGYLLLKYGEEAAYLLPYAVEIEESIRITNKNLSAEGHKFQFKLEKLSLARLKGFGKEINYVGQFDDPAFAAACEDLIPRISQEGFTLGVNARRNISTIESIPDIGLIDGNDLGFPEYYMVKLARADPRIMLVGCYVDTCDHVDGGSAITELSVTSPYVGCYAMFRKTGDTPDLLNDKIVAKTTVYRGPRKRNQDGILHSNLIFNAWIHICLKETNKAQRIENPNKLTLTEAFLTEAAERAVTYATAANKMDPVRKVLIGKYIGDAEIFILADEREKPRINTDGFYDSDIQYVVLDLDKNTEKETAAAVSPSSQLANSSSSSLSSRIFRSA